MTTAEMKKKIVERIELLETDSSLNEIIKLLDSLDKQAQGPIDLSVHYSKITQQYGDVLKKLAE